MKIAVIGAGIVGVTTAFELAQDQHEVTVFEQHGAAAEECSFANAGVLAPGYVTPWAAPGMPTKVMGQLMARHSSVKLSLPLSGRDVAWMWQWFRACRPGVYQTNRERLQSLAFYSRERLQHITAELQLEYEQRQGYLVLQRSEKDRRLAQPGLQVLRDNGIKFDEISADAARTIEPALNPDTEFVGAIYLAQDGVANCRQFTLQLKNQAQRLGVNFLFNTKVERLAHSNGPELHVASEASPRRFDAVVVCAGVACVDLLQPLGIRLPLVPVYGYSVSAPLREALNAPASGVMDERYKVAITRLGQRVRVAGSAELGGYPGVKREASLRTLYKVLQDWFPGAAQFSSGVQEWKGARPMMPDGPPVIGPSASAGVWLNLGHGSSGWALSCGSARVIADLIAQRTPSIDMTGLGLDRLR